MSRTHKLTNETFSPENFRFVDLGLPSGRLWATENAPGLYQFDEAVKTFGDHLPKGSAMVELIEESTCTWNEEKKGLDIVGPNGSSIFFPADGYTYENTKGQRSGTKGGYWTRMHSDKFNAYNLQFHPNNVYPLSCDDRIISFSVRPCKER